MRLLTITATLCLLLAAILPLRAWDVDDMNKAVDQTNFIVDERCSGTLVGLSEKFVLTNYHCVEHKMHAYDEEQVRPDGSIKKVKVRRWDDINIAQHRYDGFAQVGSSDFVATIVANSQNVDLALLKIKGDLQHSYASPLFTGQVRRGERIYTVGNPALRDATVVEGIVSNVNRTFQFPWTNSVPLPMIQFSGGIFGGNSGGALYNSEGKLIGVPGAKDRSDFIGYAVPHFVVTKFLIDNCFGVDAAGAVITDKVCVDKRAKAEKDRENNKTSD